MKNIQRDLFQTSTAVPTRAISNVNTSDISGLLTRLSRRRPPRSTLARRRVRSSMPGAMQNQRPSSSESRNGNVAAAEPIRAETSSNTPQKPQKPASEPEIVRVTLDQNQAAILGPVIDKHRDATRITGLLAALTRSYRPAAGMVTLELQVLEADQRTIAAVRKIAGR
jgi:hypothetical protein